MTETSSTPSHLRGAGRLVAVLLTIIATGCTHPVLGRPAFLGASVTAGVGTEVPIDADQTESDEGAPVSMALAYDAIVTARTDTSLDFGDPGVFLDPMPTLREQAVAAAARKPSLVIAIDWTFWPLHQSFPASLSEAERASRRLAAFDDALAELDRFECPVLVGDIPTMPEARGVIGDDACPGDEVIAEANDRLRRWAAADPNHFVIPVGELIERTSAGTSSTVVGVELGSGTTRPMVQSDGLHATADGLVILASAAVSSLEEAGLIEPGLRLVEMDRIDDSIAAVAVAARSRRDLGVLDTMSLMSLGLQHEDAMRAGDDARAAEVGARILDRLESFTDAPDGDRGWAIRNALRESATATDEMDLPLMRDLYRRHWQAIRARTLGDHPDPWLVELWLKYAIGAGVEYRDQTLRELAERGARRGGWPEALANRLWNDLPSFSPDALAVVFSNPKDAFKIAEARAHGLQSVPSGDPYRDYIRPVGPYAEYLGSCVSGDRIEQRDEFASICREDDDLFERMVFVVEWGQLLEYRDAVWPNSFERSPRPKVLGAIRGSDAGSGGARVSARAQHPLPGHGKQFSLPGPGFGWFHGLDGAVAAFPGMREQFIVTRIELDDEGRFQLSDDPLPMKRALSDWTALEDPIPGGIGIYEREPDAIVVQADVPVGGFTRTSLFETARESLSTGGPREEGRNAVTILAIGVAAEVTVRVPMGIDPDDGDVRWAEMIYSDAPIVIIGGAGAAYDTAHGCAGTGRMHATWLLDGELATGEIVGMNGFVPQRSDELEQAILRRLPAGSRLDWLPDNGLQIAHWRDWEILPTISEWQAAASAAEDETAE